MVLLSGAFLLLKSLVGLISTESGILLSWDGLVIATVSAVLMLLIVVGRDDSINLLLINDYILFEIILK
jgi:hypothetical protein